VAGRQKSGALAPRGKVNDMTVSFAA